MKTHLFGDNIIPACEYCEHGVRSKDGTMIDCEREGVVSPYFRCKKFIYSPVKRIPKQSPKIGAFTKKDFSL